MSPSWVCLIVALVLTVLSMIPWAHPAARFLLPVAVLLVIIAVMIGAGGLGYAHLGVIHNAH